MLAHDPRRRLLFVAESITLAQVVRLRTLALALDRDRYEVHFACSRFEPLIFDDCPFERWPIRSLDEAECRRRMERGARLHELAELEGYVEQELQLLKRVRPALVVGDLRPSLAVSCELAGVPFATLINAYWSPYAVRDRFPVPDHPLVELFGAGLSRRSFPLIKSAVFVHHARPLNAVRKRRGLAPAGSLLQMLTRSDFALYPDVPELCPTRELPPTHRYLGHVPWSPAADLPDDFTRARCPRLYVTLGSSGRLSALPALLEAIARLPVVALLAGAGRELPISLPKNVIAQGFVPGPLAARASDVVITNGGSSSGYQALAEGKPVLGIASNLDQYLAMTSIAEAGAGVLLRAGQLTGERALRALLEVQRKPAFRLAAERLAQVFATYDCHENFAHFLEDVFARGEHHAKRSPYVH